jgi:MarR family transcriptional regulator, transcriptional regulator for hemolysin
LPNKPAPAKDDLPDDDHIGFLVSDVARLIRTAFDRRVHRLGLTRAQWLVLTRLNRRPGASQSELADMLEVERATAGRMVDRLERKGWVIRRPDATDRRINRLFLSPEADRIRAEMLDIADQTLEDALAPLSVPERRQLGDALARVKQQLLTMADREPTARSSTGRPKQEQAA